MDVGRLAHEVGTVRRRERQVDVPPAREQRSRLRDPFPHERVGVVEPGDSDLELLERL